MHACPLSYALLWPTLIRNLLAVLHEVAMEIRTLRGCREAFVLLNGCKGLQKHMWASWNKGGLMQFGFYSPSFPVSHFCFWKTETNRSEQGCRVSPPRSWTQTQTQQSFPLSPAVLDPFVGKVGGCRRLVKTWSREPQNPDFCLCLSITLLSSSLIKKKESKQLPLLSCAFISCYLSCGNDFVKTILSWSISSVFWRLLLTCITKASPLACSLKNAEI